MQFIEGFLIIVALLQICRNKMAIPITIMLMFFEGYSFCGFTQSYFITEHQYSDVGLVLFLFMQSILLLRRKPKLDMSILKPVKVGIIIFAVFFAISACVDLLINEEKFISVIKTLRNWLCLSALWSIPYLRIKEIKTLLNNLLVISVIIAAIFLVEFYFNISFTGAIRSARGSRASIPWLISFLVFILLFNDFYKINSFWKWAFIGVIAFEYFMTGTRSIFIACLIVVIAIILFNGKRISVQKMMVFTSVFAAVGIVLATDNILTERLFTTSQDIKVLRGNSRQGGNLSFRLLMLEERAQYVNTKTQYMVFGIGNVQESDLKQHLFHIGLKGPRGRVVQLDTSDIAWVLLLLRYGYVGTAVYIFCVYFMMTRVYYRNKSYPIGYAVLVYLFSCLVFLSYTSSYIASSFFWLMPIILMRLLPSFNNITPNQKKIKKRPQLATYDR